MNNLTKYVYNVLLTLDQSINVILLGGDPDVSISSHLSLAIYIEDSGKGTSKRFVRPFARFVDVLFHNKFYTIEKEHIKNSYEQYESNHKALWKWYTIKEDSNG